MSDKIHHVHSHAYPSRLKELKCYICGGTMVPVWKIGNRITVVYVCRGCGRRETLAEVLEPTNAMKEDSRLKSR